MFSYRTTIPAAWMTIRRHRAFWLPALAVTVVGTLAETEILGRASEFGQPSPFSGIFQGVASSGLFTAEGLAQVRQLASSDPVALLALLGLNGLVLLFLLGVGAAAIVAQGALVHGVALVGAGRVATLSGSLPHGFRRFWPVLGCNLLVKGAALALFGSLWWATPLPPPLFIPLFASAGVIVLWLFLVLKYAVAAVVLEDRGTVAAFRRAVGLVHRRPLEHLELVAMLFLIAIAVGGALALAVQLTLIPFNLLLGVAALLQFTSGGLLYFYLSWAVIIAEVLAAAVAVTGVHWAATTLSFVQLATGHKIK